MNRSLFLVAFIFALLIFLSSSAPIDSDSEEQPRRHHHRRHIREGLCGRKLAYYIMQLCDGYCTGEAVGDIASLACGSKNLSIEKLKDMCCPQEWFNFPRSIPHAPCSDLLLFYVCCFLHRHSLQVHFLCSSFLDFLRFEFRVPWFFCFSRRLVRRTSNTAALLSSKSHNLVPSKSSKIFQLMYWVIMSHKQSISWEIWENFTENEAVRICIELVRDAALLEVFRYFHRFCYPDFEFSIIFSCFFQYFF